MNDTAKNINPINLLSGIICFVPILFWASSLSFFPLPWPDDSTIYLAGIDWLSDLTRFRMHNQAPFVPSYDLANFNTMPLYTLIIGVFGKWGLQGVHGLRFLGALVYCLWLALLYFWMKKQNLRPAARTLILFAAATSPMIRMSGILTRQEIWQGTLGLLMIWKIPDFVMGRSRWTLPILLATAALIHVEAIGWVPMVAIASYFAIKEFYGEGESLRVWFSRMLALGERTLLLLSPWLFYVICNLSLYREQMGIQFQRILELQVTLGNDNILLGFWQHGFGMPMKTPILDRGLSVLVWIWFSFALIGGAALIFSRKSRPTSFIAAGSWVSLTTFFCMYLAKPEVWFITLIYISLFMLTVALVKEFQRQILKRVLFGFLCLYAIGSFQTTFSQWQSSKKIFDWQNYAKWIDCIDRAIGERRIVWQPQVLDTLIDLHQRKPNREYVRANDFDGVVPWNEKEFIPKVDSFLVTQLFFPQGRPPYEGIPRTADIVGLKNAPMVNLSTVMKNGYEARTCHFEPFWALVSNRIAPESYARPPQTR